MSSSGVRQISLNSAPSDYDAQMAQIQRQQQLAQMLQQQASEPLTTSSYNGIQAPISPLSVLAKALQAYSAGALSNKATKAQTDLSASERKAAVDALNGFNNQPATGGTQYEIPSPTLNGVTGPSEHIMVGQTPGAANTPEQQQAMVNQYMLSDNPYLSKMAPVLQAQIKAADAPYTLSPGQHHFVGGKDVASVPEKIDPNKPFNTDGTPNAAYQAYEAGLKPPPMRTIQRGTTSVDQQYNPETKQWTDISSGPKFKPDDTANEGAGLSEAARANAAERYNATGVLPPLGMGKSGANDREAILNYAAILATNKGLKPEQLVQNIANYKANSGSLNQQTRQFNAMEQNASTAKNSLNLALQVAKAGGTGPSDSPVLNRWIQAGRVAVSGDPQVQALQNHLSAFAEDYARVMTANSGNAAATDSARAKAYERLSAANSYENLQKISEGLLQEMGGRHYAARKQIGSLQDQISGSPYAEPQGVQQPAPSATKGKSVRFEDLP